jgi:hypothetical protein
MRLDQAVRRRATIFHDDAERLKREAAESGRYGIRLWAILSLIISLTMVAIFSKNHPANLWAYATALIVITALALCFRNRIVWLGPYVFVAILVVILGVAVLFST